MSKKVLLSIAPLLAVIAFAAMPALASAAPRELGTESSGVFSPFKEGTPVKVTSTISTKSGAMILDVLNDEAGIECAKVTITETAENKAGVGRFTKSAWIAAECKGTGEFAACSINPKTKKHEVSWEMVGEVLTSGTEIDMEMWESFKLNCEIGGEEKEFGGASGNVTGSQNVKSNRLIFSPEKGQELSFLGLPAKLVLELEAVTKTGSQPVVIG